MRETKLGHSAAALERGCGLRTRPVFEFTLDGQSNSIRATGYADQ